MASYVRRRDEEARRETADHMAFVAHELRNPISAARMALAVLRKGPLASGGRLVDSLERSLTRLRDLVEHVLTVERLTGVAVQYEPVAIQQLAEEVVSDAEPDAEDKNVRVVVDVAPELVVGGDHRLLLSALTNLVRNGIKFTATGGRVTVRARAHGQRVLVEVEDECGGLPEDAGRDLFAPFVQRGEDRRGFGLGLAIVKQAVEAHGGQVTVQDRPGAGCVFVLDLPAGPRPA